MKRRGCPLTNVTYCIYAERSAVWIASGAIWSFDPPQGSRDPCDWLGRNQKSLKSSFQELPCERFVNNMLKWRITTSIRWLNCPVAMVRSERMPTHPNYMYDTYIPVWARLGYNSTSIGYSKVRRLSLKYAGSWTTRKTRGVICNTKESGVKIWSVYLCVYFVGGGSFSSSLVWQSIIFWKRTNVNELAQSWKSRTNKQTTNSRLIQSTDRTTQTTSTVPYPRTKLSKVKLTVS